MLPRDLACIVLDYCLGPDEAEHIAHHKVMSQLAAVWKDPGHHMFWFFNLQTKHYHEPVRDRHTHMINRMAGAWFYVKDPAHLVMANLVKYDRPYELTCDLANDHACIRAAARRRLL